MRDDVIGSLLFVALEIQQNTEAVRSSVIHDISRWSYDATVLMIQTPEYRDAIQAECTGKLSEDQRFYLRLFYAAFLRLQMDRFYQSQLGILDEPTALALGGRGGAYRHQSFAELWPELKEAFEPDFQLFVERELLPMAQTTTC